MLWFGFYSFAVFLGVNVVLHVSRWFVSLTNKQTIDTKGHGKKCFRRYSSFMCIPISRIPFSMPLWQVQGHILKIKNSNIKDTVKNGVALSDTIQVNLVLPRLRQNLVASSQN